MWSPARGGAVAHIMLGADACNTTVKHFVCCQL